jgi:hypothetical protein
MNELRNFPPSIPFEKRPFQKVAMETVWYMIIRIDFIEYRGNDARVYGSAYEDDLFMFTGF